MTDQKYILDADHNLIPVDLMTWAKWFETGERRVAETEVGAYWVSTVFLGIDHNFSGKGPPILFETMVFEAKAQDAPSGDPSWSELDQRRYATWQEAERGHEEVVTEWRKHEHRN